MPLLAADDALDDDESLPSLRTLFATNRWFFIGFAIYLMLGSIGLLLLNHGDLLLWMNARRTPFWDTFFRYGTRLGEEFAFLIALLLLLRRYPRQALFIPLLGLTIMVSSWLAKRVFQQARPSEFYKLLNRLEELQFIDGVHAVKGYTSFPSGHTMAAFGLWTFVALTVVNKRWAGMSLFFLATVVALSRIYLIQHFLRDVYVGAILGVVVGVLGYVASLWWERGHPARFRG